MTTAKETIDNLKQCYKPTDHIAVAIWSVEDVLTRAEERGMKVSKKQAEEILDRINRKQSADLGINWNTIDCYLDEL